MFKLLEILYHIKQNYDFDFSLILSIKSFLLESNIKKHYPIQLTAQIFQNRTILTIEYPNFINIHVILDLEFL